MNKLKNLIFFIVAMTLALLNTMILPSILFILTILKIIIPIKNLKKTITAAMFSLSKFWVAINRAITESLTNTEIDLRLPNNLSKDQNYLIISNHQSWSDITLLQSYLHKQVPFLRFFMKRNLIYLPFIGLACWALDFPFMYRFSKEYIRKHPEKKGKDLEATIKACSKLKDFPTSILNFVEGTRKTDEKHKRQSSTYKHLLRPKAGGLSYVLNVTKDTIHQVLNITIYYPDGKPNFFKLLSNQMSKVIIDVKPLSITDDLYGDYQNDPEYQTHFQNWINKVWEDKDRLIDEIAKEHNKLSTKELHFSSAVN